MKWLIILLGVVLLALGLIPLVYDWGYLPIFLEFIPREGMYYNLLVAVAGGILTYIGIARM